LICAFFDGSYLILYLIFNYKVPHFGLMMKTHISTVDRTRLVISEKVFWDLCI
jgi:hypothetical protein